MCPSWLYLTDILVCHSSLKGLVDKIAEHFLLFTGTTEPKDFADLCWFLQRKRDYVLSLLLASEMRCTQTAKSEGHIIIILLLILLLPETYYSTSDEGDGHWKHLLHLFFTEFGSTGWPGQVVTQIFDAIHDLFLE